MDILKINPNSPDKAVLKKAASVIKNGGVVVYPTDTAYGLAADALNEHAIGKLFIIKQRIQKPLPVIVDSEKMLSKVAIVSNEEKKIIKKYWPGALTIIFTKQKSVPSFLTLGLSTIGVRIPNNKIALEFITACGTPLTSTSANISGQGNCYSIECVTKMFRSSESQPDLLLDAGELAEVPVSTIIKVEQKKISIIRHGPIKIK